MSTNQSVWAYVDDRTVIDVGLHCMLCGVELFPDCDVPSVSIAITTNRHLSTIHGFVGAA